MRILVTGAAGFLGRHLVAELASRGHEVIAAGHDAAWPVDFRLIELVAELFAETAPEHVLHLAGTSRAGDHLRGPVELQAENIVHPLLNVLECAGPRRVLHVSASVVYGAGSTDETGPLRPNDLYGAARASAETLALRRASRFGQDLVIARPSLLLGADMSPNSEVGGWFADHAAGRPVRAVGLDQPRDVLDVRDAARGLLAVLERGLAGRAYNLTSGRALTPRALVSAMIKGEPQMEELLAAGRAAPAKVGASPGANALGWAPEVELESTLASVGIRAPSGRR